MKNSFSRRLLTIAFLLIVQTAFAEGWKFPNLNPFSKSEEKPKPRQRVRDEEKSSWSMPSLPKIPTPKMPSFTVTEKSRPPFRKEPSTWEKMNTGTKNFFGKTKETLMPWSKTASNSPSKSTSSRSVAQKGEPKKGFISSMFGEEKEKKITDVNDWLAQPSPSILDD